MWNLKNKKKLVDIAKKKQIYGYREQASDWLLVGRQKEGGTRVGD